MDFRTETVELDIRERTRRVERSREDLARALSELRGGVKQALSWRGLVERYPVAAAGTAALVGFWLSARLRRHRRGRASEPASRRSEPSRRRAAVAAALVSSFGRVVIPLLAERATELLVERLAHQKRVTASPEDSS